MVREEGVCALPTLAHAAHRLVFFSLLVLRLPSEGLVSVWGRGGYGPLGRSCLGWYTMKPINDKLLMMLGTSSVLLETIVMKAVIDDDDERFRRTRESYKHQPFRI